MEGRFREVGVADSTQTPMRREGNQGGIFYLLRSMVATSVDLLFPKTCLGCDSEGDWVCSACLSALKRYRLIACAGCGRNVQGGSHACSSCLEKFCLSDLQIAFDYNDPLVQKMIHALKYEYIEELSGVLGKFLAENAVGCYRQYEVLCPVPLHKRRLLERGFNQSELLARAVGEILGIPVHADLLLRTKYTQPQVGLARERRLTNVSGAFGLHPRFFALAGSAQRERIWLIDDVFTTGSTLFECAKVLKKSGYHEVGALVVAKG